MAVNLASVGPRRVDACPRVIPPVWVLPVLVFGLAGSTACERDLSEQECQQLLDRYVELLVQSRMPDASVEAVEEMQSEARERARSAPRFKECSEFFSRRDFECAVKRAKSVDEMERCLL